MKAFSSAEPISARAIAISSIQGTFKEHVLFKLKQKINYLGSRKEMVATDPNNTDKDIAPLSGCLNSLAGS